LCRSSCGVAGCADDDGDDSAAAVVVAVPSAVGAAVEGWLLDDFAAVVGVGAELEADAAVGADDVEVLVPFRAGVSPLALPLDEEASRWSSALSASAL
jgi:hypothetical protein